MKNNKLLLISYFFYPITSCQSNKFELLLPYLLNEYDQIDVLTSMHIGLKHQEQIGSLNIYRVNSKFLIKNYSKELKEKEIISNFGSKLYFFIKNLIRKFYPMIIWPDFAFLWRKVAQKEALNLQKKNNYSHVISISFPFTAHRVAYKMKKKYPQIHLILDYIDPFSILESHEQPSNNSNLYSKLNHYYEGRINKLADRVFYSYEAFLIIDKNIFGSWNKKNLFIWDPWLTISKEDYHKKSLNPFVSNQIVYLYLGSLSNSIRPPDFSLNFFKKFLNLNEKVYLVGNKHDCERVCKNYSEQFPEKYELISNVSKELAITMLKHCNFLIFIDNIFSKQLPSKILEYLYTGKKILFFAQNYNSPTYLFLKRENLNLHQIFFIIEEDPCTQDMETIRGFIEIKEHLFTLPNKFTPQAIAPNYCPVK